MVPRRFEWNFRKVGFNVISVVDDWGISCEVAFRWMSPDITYDKSTMDQVMAWCRQETSHFLSQCWPRSKQAYLKCRYISIFTLYMIYRHVVDDWGISSEVEFRWMSPFITYDKSTMVQEMACFLTASSHYLKYRDSPQRRFIMITWFYIFEFQQKRL